MGRPRAKTGSRDSIRPRLKEATPGGRHVPGNWTGTMTFEVTVEAAPATASKANGCGSGSDAATFADTM